MTSATYLPGSWAGIIGDAAWLLLDAPADGDRVADLWQEAQAPDVGRLLDAVLRHGLSTLPGLALAVAADDGLRIVVRGTGAVVVRRQDGTEARYDGEGLATWREDTVADATSVTLSAGEAGLGGLPASAGVVLAAAVTVALQGEAPKAARPRRPTPAAAPAPVVVPAPAPSVVVAAPPQAPVVPEETIDPATAFAPVAGGSLQVDDGADDSYDFLFEATQARTVEGAAVRPEEVDEFVFDLAEPQALAVASAPAPAPNLPVAEPVVERPSPAAVLPPAAGADLIDSVPWAPGGAGSAKPAPAMPEPPAVVAPSQPAVVAQSPAPAIEQAVEESTVKRSDAMALARAAVLTDRIGPTVHAVLCPTGHVNPPEAAQCRLCSAALPPQEPVTLPRPVLGVLRLSTGDIITLDRGVLLGRSPRDDNSGDERPHVVKLTGGEGEISRNHVRITLDGWHVLVTDLKSTNGTMVTIPGREPSRLRPNDPTPISDGTRVTLAPDVHFTYEVAQ